MYHGADGQGGDCPTPVRPAFFVGYVLDEHCCLRGPGPSNDLAGRASVLLAVHVFVQQSPLCQVSSL
jgi:hypothetical protein